jgi:hypothetical protein
MSAGARLEILYHCHKPLTRSIVGCRAHALAGMRLIWHMGNMV